MSSCTRLWYFWIPWDEILLQHSPINFPNSSKPTDPRVSFALSLKLEWDLALFSLRWFKLSLLWKKVVCRHRTLRLRVQFCFLILFFSFCSFSAVVAASQWQQSSYLMIAFRSTSRVFHICRVRFCVKKTKTQTCFEDNLKRLSLRLLLYLQVFCVSTNQIWFCKYYICKTKNSMKDNISSNFDNPYLIREKLKYICKI